MILMVETNGFDNGFEFEERLRFIPKQSLSREDICILETL